MLNGIVEQENLADSPAPLLKAHTKPTPVRNNQGQMRNQSRIAFPIMGRDVGMRCQGGKHGIGTLPGNVRGG